MPTYAGDTYREDFPITDEDNQPILGAVYELLNISGPDGEYPVSLLELGGGVYQVVVQTLVDWSPGVYTATLSPEVDTSLPVFFFSFTLSAGSSAVATGGMTRQDLRRKIASNLRDLVVVSAESGDTNLIVNSVELTEFDNTYVSAQILCTRAAHPENLGRVTRVVSSKLATTSLTVSPPFPKAVQPGDEFEIVNLRGKGFRIQEYNRAITLAVAGLSSGYFRRATSDPVELDSFNAVIDIPDGWRGVYRAEVLFEGEPPYHPIATRTPHAAGYYVNTATRQVELRGSWVGACHGQNVVLYGLIPHPPLTNDEDVCYIDDVYIALVAQSELSAQRGDRESNQWAVQWAQQAAAQRPAKLFRYPADTVLLEE